MSKTLRIGSLLGVIIVLLVGAFLIFKPNESPSNTDKVANNTESTPVSTVTSPTPQTTVAAKDPYITLAEYTSNPEKYVSTKKVYFFHASWCPICQGIDKEITADTSKIPEGVTLIKTDFDSSVDLRKKYGVTYQYTFVQVDANGNEIAQWSATSLTKALTGIKS